ncbi:hypothetical protein [Sporosarcina sp. FA9]|uniref:hypothetical protein n=1 Tax=Sporosarcina sp. FA9 TaxID=3413030 RepID=UPI003F65D922
MEKMFLVMFLSILFVLQACSAGDDADKEVVKDKEEDNKTEETGGALEVDKGLLNVEVTIPSSFMEGEDIDQVVADAKESGIKNATKNEDGSVTYKVSKVQHKEMMKEMKTNVSTYIEELVSGDDFASIKDIEHNGSFSEFTVVVDKEAFEGSMDGFATLGLAMSGMYYQAFNGTNAEKLKVTVNTKDADTGEIIGTAIYPDVLNEMED